MEDEFSKTNEVFKYNRQTFQKYFQINKMEKLSMSFFGFNEEGKETLVTFWQPQDNTNLFGVEINKVKVLISKELFFEVMDFFINTLEAGSTSKEAIVSIAIPQKEIDLFKVEQIQNSVGDFMEAMGFELETKDEPVHGSFFQNLKFVFKKKTTTKELENIYESGIKALETKYRGLPTAEETSKLAEASASLIKATEGIDSIALRCGRILIVKTDVLGKSRIIIDTISPTLMNLLDEKPHLIHDPQLMYQLLVKTPTNPMEFEGDEPLKIV